MKIVHIHCILIQLIFQNLKMTAKTLVWREQNGDIWKIANELHEQAMQVDVYLQATGNEVFSENECGISAASPTAEERQCYKRIITFPAHRLMLAAASPFLRKVSFPNIYINCKKVHIHISSTVFYCY